MYEQDVARGVATLDDVLPGWRDRVDVTRLDVASVCDCVVGQALGVDDHDTLVGDDDELGWHAALSTIGAPPGETAETSSPARDRWCEERGFESRFVPGTGVRDYGRLTATWVAYLRGELELSPVDVAPSNDEESA